MNEIPNAISPHEFLNPTGNPLVDANDLRSVIVQRLGEIQKLGSANKAGARLRVERATNTHLAILADIMSGQPVRLDLTQGESLSVHFGGRRIHIPTFNDRTMSVVQAGVRYAPLQHAVWDDSLKQTRIVGAEQSLAHTLQGLIRDGIKDAPIAEQASMIAAAFEDFRNRGLLHLRFGPQAVGAASPYYLSHQVALGASHPATRAAMQVEALIGQALQTMKSNTVTGGEVGKTGVQEAQSYVRKALAHQLAIGLMLFEKDSPIRSTGVKSLRLRGMDAFGGQRSVGSEGRLIASDLPSWAYGVIAPGEQLAKGLHHRRSLMGMSTQDILQIRQEGARLRGMKAPKITSNRLLMSSYDVEAGRVAAQHFGQMGTSLPGGVAQLDTPILAGVMRPKAGLTPEELGKANTLLTLLFGDSQALPASPELTQIASMHSRYRTTRTTQLSHSKSAGYANADLHPALREAIEKAGVGGPVTLESPITFDMLGGRIEQRVGRGGRQYQKVVQKARIGGALTSSGQVRTTRSGKIVGEYLRPGEEITGFRSGPGGTQVVIRRTGEVAMQEGTPVLLTKKRMSLGRQARGFRGVDVVAAGGKMGVDLSAPDALLYHVTSVIHRKAGKEGLADVATALGGELKEIGFGQREIRYGSEELIPQMMKLFPAGTDGAQNLDRVKAVLDVAEKHGILIGPKSETERKALLTDIFERGNTSRIGELYRGLDITNQETHLRELLGAKNFSVLGGKNISDYLEMTRQFTTMAQDQAGQPGRGQFGRVSVRMRDLRMYAMGTAASGGADVLSMYRSNNVVKTAFGLTGAEADATARGMRHYGRMWRSTVERPMGLENYIEGMVAAAEGRVSKLSGNDFEIVSLEDYRKRFGSGLNKVPRRGELADLRGTPFVEEIDGQLRPTRKTLVVQMPEKGAISLSRPRKSRWTGKSIDVRAAEMDHVLVPSGETLGLRQGEVVNFSTLEGRGLRSSFGRQAVKLHGELVGGPAISAYRAAGATAITGAEHYFGRGGLRHRGPGFGVKASFSGTLISDATLEVGEVGVSRTTAREMLRRQGWKGADLEAKLRSVEGGQSEFFTHFKTEPMRAPEHLTQAKVRILPSEVRTKGVGGTMVTRADEAIHVNPLGLFLRERDFDYDPGYLFNLAQKKSKSQLGAFHAEQTALKVLWEKNRAEHKAITEVAQQIVAKVNTKKAGEHLTTRAAEMIADARKIAADFMGRQVNEGANTVEHALAQTMAATPELLTPIGNVRHRTRVQILEDIAMGRDLDGMIMKTQQAESKEALQHAMATLRNDLPSLSWLHTTAKASEYTVLKKAHAEQALGNIEHLAGTPDTLFSALAANLRIGTARPGTAAAETEIGHIMNPLMDVLSLGEGGEAEVFTRAGGVSREQLARRMAVSYQAASFLERQGVMSAWQGFLTDPSASGTAIHGTNGWMNQFTKFMYGRDPEFAGRLFSGGHNWGGVQAGVAVAARQAGDAAVATGGAVIGGFAKRFVDGSSELLGKLWKSKWGKWGMAGAGLIAAVSAGKDLFGGGGGDSPPGAPMPPPPMLSDPGPERMLDYTGVPTYGEARIGRVPQVRTHYQVSGRTSSNMDFREVGSAALGAFGRKPVHAGTFIDTRAHQNRHRIEQEITDRMYSDF